MIDREERLRVILPYCKNKKVLDVGCVGGENNPFGTPKWRHQYIAEVADECVGIDIQGDMEKIREEGFNVHQANVERMDLKEKFQVVTAMEVFEHLENPGLALQRIADHLVPEGHLILTTPNPLHYQKLLGNLWNSQRHICYHHPIPFKRFVQRFGFQEQKIEWLGENWKNAGSLKGKLFMLMNPLPDRLAAVNWLGVYQKECYSEENPDT